MNAIPFVSDGRLPLAYHARMAKEDWRTWGKRFKKHAYPKHNLESLAETLGRSAASLRHWTNGTREINLSEFIELCGAAGVDPALVLFGKPTIGEETEKRITDAVVGALREQATTEGQAGKRAPPQRHKSRR